MKTHVITLAKKFPTTHRRAGQYTGFAFKFATQEKRHTIRTNFDYWKKKIDEVRLDEAVLSVREWSGKPYRTPQHDIFDLSSDYPVGYQKLIITEIGYKIGEVHYTKAELVDVLASNDGLFTEDFEDWFKDVKIGDELIIIHFTEFRYN